MLIFCSTSTFSKTCENKGEKVQLHVYVDWSVMCNRHGVIISLPGLEALQSLTSIN